MLWRRVILGTVVLALAILAAQLGRVLTSAEDKVDVLESSESQAESSVQAQADSADGSSDSEREGVEIPLDKIWGHDRSLRGLEPELFIIDPCAAKAPIRALALRF